MLRDCLKPELLEDSKVKPILEYHADRIINIINQDVITYEDFKRLVKVVFKNSKKLSDEGSYTYERELHQLYDEYRLFKRFFTNKERAEKLVKALRELNDNKSFQVDKNLDK